MPAFAPPLHLHAQDRRWYVVRSKARKEDYAVQQLERRGVRDFLPRILEWGRDEVAPLFPGYLFVCIALRSEEHTSELQSRLHLVCRLLLEKKKKNNRV